MSPKMGIFLPVMMTGITGMFGIKIFVLIVRKPSSGDFRNINESSVDNVVDWTC